MSTAAQLVRTRLGRCDRHLPTKAVIDSYLHTTNEQIALLRVIADAAERQDAATVNTLVDDLRKLIERVRY